jgi:hypothetical protein
MSDLLPACRTALTIFQHNPPDYLPALKVRQHAGPRNGGWTEIV